jgi:hypothetical protein
LPFRARGANIVSVEGAMEDDVSDRMRGSGPRRLSSVLRRSYRLELVTWCVAWAALTGCGGSLAAPEDGGIDDDADAGSEAETDGDADVAPDEGSDADAEADVAPDEGPDADADGDADDDGPPEADSDASADADADGDEDSAAEADAAVPCDPAAAPAGTSCDPTSGLLWENPPDDTSVYWDVAVSYCDGLSLGGHDDWVMPTVDELRSLIRGCPATETGGTCGVTDACLAFACRDRTCDGCTVLAGPGTGGCYWDPALSGTCSWYWSSSPFDPGPTGVWYVVFDFASVQLQGVDYHSYVRCVHHGP